jgi:phosphohistidine phosphatase
VLILRHAIAAERDRLRWPNDALRPLTARGVRRFRRAARGLAQLAPRPDEVWSSPLRRARETAALAAAHAHWPVACLTPALRPGVAAPLLGARLAARCGDPDAPRRLALVGHEPGLSHFIAWAVGAGDGAAFALRKGGAALLEFDGSVRAGGARLLWLATPRLLRALRRASR